MIPYPAIYHSKKASDYNDQYNFEYREKNVSSLQEPNGYGAAAAAAGNGYSAGESGAASTVKSNQSDGSIINSRDSPNNTKMFVGGISKNTNTGTK